MSPTASPPAPRAARPSYLYAGVLLALLLGGYGGLFALWLGGNETLYLGILNGIGVHPFDWPFLDTHAVLSSAQCHRAGIDILKYNPCDVLNRVSSYSPLWLDLTPGFLTTADTTIVGALLGLAFIVMLPGMLRPSSRADLVWSCAAAFSTMAAFALERGNIDLVMFLLAAGAALLCGGSGVSRGIAYALCLAAGLLKYYPLVLLVTAARERLRTFLLILLASVLIVGAVALFYGDRLTGALAIVPNQFALADISGDFGAKDLPLGLTVIALGSNIAAMPVAMVIIATLIGLFSYLLVRLVIGRISRARFTIDWNALDSRCIIIGALLICGCFFAGQSIGYRGIHFLFIIPALLRWRRCVGDAALRRVFTLALTAILLVMWSEGIRGVMNAVLTHFALPTTPLAPAELVFWAVRELIWWWIVSVLVAIIARFVSESPGLRLGIMRGRKMSLQPTV